MRNANELRLVSLDAMGDWDVAYNQLYDLDPSEVIHIQEQIPSVWALVFVQDLLQLINSKDGSLIDVGWYPDGDAEGSYKIELVPKIKDELDWVNSTVVCETRSLNELLACIKELVGNAQNPSCA